MVVLRIEVFIVFCCGMVVIYDRIEGTQASVFGVDRVSGELVATHKKWRHCEYGQSCQCAYIYKYIHYPLIL